MSNITNLLNS